MGDRARACRPPEGSFPSEDDGAAHEADRAEHSELIARHWGPEDGVPNVSTVPPSP
jgi:hypothetical protein